MSKHRHKNVSWCDGWDYVRHPTDRKLKEVIAIYDHGENITIELCPTCLKSFNERRSTEAEDEKSI